MRAHRYTGLLMHKLGDEGRVVALPDGAGDRVYSGRAPR